MTPNSSHMDQVELDLDNGENEAFEPLIEKTTIQQWPWKRSEFAHVSRQQNSKARKYLAFARTGLLVVLAVVGIASLGLNAWRLIKGPPLGYAICRCGSSTAEAKAMGCKLDLLGPAWYPDHCRDDELTTEFLKGGGGPNGTWQFWKDHAHTIPMTIEEVSLIPDDPEGAFYSTWEFHVKHCTFQWRKFIRSLERGIVNVDMENTGTGHVDHCEMVIMNGYPVRATIPLNVPALPH